MSLMKPRKPQRYDLLPWDAIDELAAHYGRGAAKYEAREWESKGYPWSDYFNAMQRHAARFWGGEDRDPEDEFLHATAMAWNALALLTFALRDLPGDDRPGNQPAQEA